MEIISILLGILAIGVIALIHEVGHYFFARRAGIKVLELSLGAGPVILSFEKNGTKYTIRPIPFLAFVRLEEEGEESVGKASIFQRFLLYIGGVFFNLMTAIILITLIGVFSGIYTDKVIVGDLIEDKPAYSILKRNDQIIEVNKAQIDDFVALEEELTKSKGSEVELTVIRAEKEIKLNIVPELDQESDRYVLGFFFAKEKLDIFSSFGNALNMIWITVSQTFILLGNLFIGQANPTENLVGIIGIVAISSDFTTKIADYMFFIAAISIGMAVINILPIPALDGGKIVLLGVEKAIGRKISEKLEYRLTIVGFGLLIILMVFTTINDILRLVGG
ncbi:MAG: regulator of sigma E protease [Fusobacteria bacterium]|nr:MAG: regulator of sigma E protease [Fusobacteriota bacterium]KAF0229959.1 MAG: regulator of sigma E [Fusobacteriota bacterium]